MQLSDEEIEQIKQIARRAVKKALRPRKTNQDSVDELVGDGDNVEDRSGGRTVQGGFSSLAKRVITESDRRRRAHEEDVAKNGYAR